MFPRRDCTRFITDRRCQTRPNRVSRWSGASPNSAKALSNSTPSSTGCRKARDLHNHLSGAIYAENFLHAAVEEHLCIDKAALALTPPADRGTGQTLPRDRNR